MCMIPVKIKEKKNTKTKKKSIIKDLDLIEGRKKKMGKRKRINMSYELYYMSNKRIKSSTESNMFENDRISLY